MPDYLGSSARTETRSRRLATVTLLTFAQATVGFSALAQLPPRDLMGAVEAISDKISL